MGRLRGWAIIDFVRRTCTARLLTALLIFSALAMACVSASEQGVPDLEQRAVALNKTIMCPVCPGESIDQSQNSLAVQMRAIVRDKLDEGWTDQEIKDFLVERYGPSVLLEPPTTGFSLAAWILPPVAFALAIAALLLTLKWMRMSAEASDDATGDEDGQQRNYVSRIEDALRLDDQSDTASGIGKEDRHSGTSKS